MAQQVQQAGGALAACHARCRQRQLQPAQRQQHQLHGALVVRRGQRHTHRAQLPIRQLQRAEDQQIGARLAFYPGHWRHAAGLVEAAQGQPALRQIRQGCGEIELELRVSRVQRHCPAGHARTGQAGAPGLQRFDQTRRWQRSRRAEHGHRACWWRRLVAPQRRQGAHRCPPRAGLRPRAGNGGSRISKASSRSTSPSINWPAKDFNLRKLSQAS